MSIKVTISEMNYREKTKYKTIIKVVNGVLDKKKASIIIGCSERRINQLINIYKNEGKNGFIHKSKNRIPVNKLNSDFRGKIINLYNDKYFDFNFTHFREKLKTNENINLPYGTLYNILSEAKIKSPKKNRKNKRQNLHPSRERKKYFGELVQIDASVHLWFGDFKTYLHAAIDDATGNVLGAYFDTGETIKGYYEMTYQILTKYGIPMTFYSDRRTIFEYYSKKSVNIEKDTFTQFEAACDKLGIEIITTSIAQAKGKIERLFGTFQSRLVAELRLNNINTIEKANKFVLEYLPVYNKQFALPINYNKSLMEESPSIDLINLYLSIFTNKTVNNGSTIKHKGKLYYPQLYNQRINLPPKTKVIFIESFDHKYYILFDDKFYNAIELIVEQHIIKKEIKEKNVYRPPASHPFKAASYQRYIEKHNSKKKIKMN
jgi:hypothetical protein